MKICPKCSFANTEDFPTCVWCNTNIAGVKPVALCDPDHPEYQQQAMQNLRSAALKSQLFKAGVTYVVAITVAVMFLGAWFNPRVLLFSAGAAVVAWGVIRGLLGAILAPLAQAVLTVAAFLYIGGINPIMFFTMAAHVFFATLFITGSR